MRFRFFARAVAASLCTLVTLALSGSAWALAVSGGGIDQALGCSDVACGATQTLTFDTSGGPVAPVSGTIDLDASTLELSFSFSVLEVSLVPVSGPDDDGLTQVIFSNVSYQATALSLFDVGGGSYIIGPSQTGFVTGGLNPIGGIPPIGFGALAARVTGSCLDVGGALSCGISFGQSGFGFDVGPGDRYFQHTANVVAVPEPATAALLGLSLLAVAVAGRRDASR